eukprot:TRINITY_DN3371_c4_g1_i2.p1 TRINITY_DN3371_c4_g1~~TRINITY_DN3371_c4_g1_i2.p1  ORF type:complete len:843 (+),score=216.69 TRINITY_DN3371_c4_g1_i2:102-2630(+)
MSSLLVHRCRFVEWTPQQITAIALSPSETLAAVGRDDGNIEMWCLENNEWFVSGVLHGPKGSSCHSIVWVDEGRAAEVVLGSDGVTVAEASAAESGPWESERLRGRLFSAGLSGIITEWDLRLLVPKRVVDSYGGPVWCLSATKDGTRLAAACEDGTTRIFDLSDPSDIAYVRSMSKQQQRVLSVDWHASGKDVVTGGGDGTVRRYDVASGRCVHCMTVQNYKRNPTVVWVVKVLSDWTIVSGSSLGDVEFWDGRMGVHEQRIRKHHADIVSMAVSPNEKTIVCGGVDARISVLRRLSVSGKRSTDKWVLDRTRALHTHDVRAVVIGSRPPAPTETRKFPISSKNAEKDIAANRKRANAKSKRAFVVKDQPFSNDPAYDGLLMTGGVDCQLITLSLLKLEQTCVMNTTTRKYRRYPDTPPVCLASSLASSAATAGGAGATERAACEEEDPSQPSYRLLLVQSGAAKLQLWSLGSAVDGQEEKPFATPLELQDGAQCLLDLDVTNSSGSITCFAISPDASFIAFSDSSSLRIFRLAWPRGVGVASPEITKVRLGSGLAAKCAARRLRFSPDARLVVALLSTAHVLVLDLGGRGARAGAEAAGRAQPAVVYSIAQHAGDTRNADSESDSEEEEAAQVEVPAEDEHGNAAREGLTPGAAAVMSMDLSADGRWLVTGDILNRIHIFNLDTHTYHSTLPHYSSPHTALGLHPSLGFVVTACANGSVHCYDIERERVTAWSRDYSHLLPSKWLEQPGVPTCIAFNPLQPQRAFVMKTSCFCEFKLTKDKKKPKYHSATPVKCKLSGAFSPSLFVGFVGGDEMVCVQRPWVHAVQHLPDPVFVHKFGTG